MFKHEVSEKTQTIERQERWDTEIDGHHVGVHRREDGFTQVYLSPIHYEGSRLPLLSFHPKRIEDIELVIEKLPALLSAVVSELRSSGLVDFRSKFDLMMEESDRRRDEYMREALAHVQRYQGE